MNCSRKYQSQDSLSTDRLFFSSPNLLSLKPDIMKSKNVVSAAFAFVLAMGSAFTSASLPVVTVWVKVKYSGESAFTCRSASPLQCSNLVTDTHACAVTVADILQATNAYINSNCNVFAKGHNPGTFNPQPVIIEAPEYIDEI